MSLELERCHSFSNPNRLATALQTSGVDDQLCVVLLSLCADAPFVRLLQSVQVLDTVQTPLRGDAEKLRLRCLRELPSASANTTTASLDTDQVQLIAATRRRRKRTGSSRRSSLLSPASSASRTSLRSF